jgi:hypothetical protein
MCVVFGCFCVFYKAVIENMGFAKTPDLVGSKTFDVLGVCFGFFGGFLQRVG